MRQFQTVASKIIQKTSCSSKFEWPNGEEYVQPIKDIVESIYNDFGSVIVERLVDVIVYLEYTSRPSNSYKAKRSIGVYTSLRLKYTIAMYERYKVRKSGMLFFEDGWLAEHGLSRISLVQIAKNKEPVIQASHPIPTQYEDGQRRRFLNTNAGYVFCHMRTSGWEPQSLACQRCNFSEKCANDLQKSNNELYQKRKRL